MMPGTIQYAVLAPRERSIMDAFAKGDVWSEHYYNSWLKDRPAIGRQATRYALADGAQAPAATTISASFIRDALRSDITTENGAPARIDARGARLSGVIVVGALDLTALEFCKPIYFEDCVFKEPITLKDAKLGHVSLNGSSVPQIFANLVDIDSDFSLDGLRDCRSVGLRAARIRGSLTLQRAILTSGAAENHRALNCRGAKIGGSVWLRNGFRATGAVNFVGAAVGGRIDCRRGNFSNPGHRALDCHSASIGGSVLLRKGFNSDGEVNFVGALIMGELDCDGGAFNNPKSWALDCQGAKIGGNVLLRDGFSADGEVNFVGATIGRDFECQNGSFKGHRPHDAIDLEEAHIGGTIFLTRVKSFEGMLDLQDAVATSLADDGSVWNIPSGRAELHLDLFHYNSFANDYGERHNTPLDSKTRLSWLRHQPKGWCDENFRPQPFTQCAKALREMGHTQDARRVLYARERGRLKRADLGRIEWLVGNALFVFAGHGYKTRRAIYWLIAIWLAGAAIYPLAYWDGQMRIASEPIIAMTDYQRTGVPPDRYEPFKPVVYSLDVLLPIIDLGEQRMWVPRDGDERPVPVKSPDWWWPSLLDAVARLVPNLYWLPKVYYWFEIVMGWFLSTIAIAGFTGVLGPERGD